MKVLQWILLVTIIGSAGLLASCTTEDQAEFLVPPDAQIGDLLIEECLFEIKEEEYLADCGTLIVPENRADPESRLIALPVTRIRATGSQPVEPIFFLGGGPGIPNYVPSRTRWFLDHHDVVILGYRGVEGSVQLNCSEVSDHIKNLPGDMLGKDSLENMTEAYARCAERHQNAGVDLGGYTVVEVIDDLEEARLALGYGKINLFSISYGTRLAMIYTWRYPESIFRSAMIAVNPPGHMFYYDPQVIDEQFDYFANLCAQDPECSSLTDDLAETMRRVSQDMPERWLGFPIDAGMIRAASFESLSDTQAAAQVFDTWLAAAKGDYSGMVLLSLAGPMMFADATVWGENISKTASADFQMTSGLRADMDLASSILGSPRSEMAAAAVGWPINTIPEEYQQVQPSEIETLVLSGSIDLWTPLQFADEELLPYLSNGQHVVVAENGHGEMLSSQPEASQRLLTTFFDTGEADDSLFTYQPMNFDPGLMSFPLLAKGLVLIVVLILGLIILLARYLIRKARRRKSGFIS